MNCADEHKAKRMTAVHMGSTKRDVQRRNNTVNHSQPWHMWPSCQTYVRQHAGAPKEAVGPPHQALKEGPFVQVGHMAAVGQHARNGHTTTAAGVQGMRRHAEVGKQNVAAGKFQPRVGLCRALVAVLGLALHAGGRIEDAQGAGSMTTGCYQLQINT